MTDDNPTTRDPEYTREEMREACRNNYNAAMQRAAEAARDIGRAISKGSLRSAGPNDTGEMIATAILELQDVP